MEPWRLKLDEMGWSNFLTMAEYLSCAFPKDFQRLKQHDLPCYRSPDSPYTAFAKLFGHSHTADKGIIYTDRSDKRL